jgi:hypothetical protein
VKAQGLSVGPAREAADTFRRSLEAAAKTAAKEKCCSDALVARASVGVLEVLATHAPHIAEADDAAMTRMEEQMATSAAAARRSPASTRRSSRCRGATATFGRWRCRWDGSARSPRSARITCRRSRMRWQSMSSREPDSSQNLTPRRLAGLDRRSLASGVVAQL